MDEQTFVAVLADISAGQATYKVLLAHGIPRPAFYAYMFATPERTNKYACAKADSLEVLADEIVEIADTVDGDSNEAVQRARLRVDSRKWLLSKMAPRKYGDKLELAGDAAAPLVINITGTDSKL